MESCAGGAVMICAHHLCRSEFIPVAQNGKYCCSACQRAARNWRKVRGEVLVSIIIEGGNITKAMHNVANEYYGDTK